MALLVGAYFVTFPAGALTAGHLASRLGARITLLLALAALATLSAGALVVDEPLQLVGLRAALGLAAGVVIGVAAIVVSPEFDGRERPCARTVWAAVSGVALAFGPFAAGVLLERFTWQAIFLVSEPLLILALALTAVLIPGRRAGTSARSILRCVGRPGGVNRALPAVLASSALGGLLYGAGLDLQRGFAGPAETVVRLGATIVVFLVSGWLTERATRATGGHLAAAVGLATAAAGFVILAGINGPGPVSHLVASTLVAAGAGPALGSSERLRDRAERHGRGAGTALVETLLHAGVGIGVFLSALGPAGPSGLLNAAVLGAGGAVVIVGWLRVARQPLRPRSASPVRRA